MMLLACVHGEGSRNVTTKMATSTTITDGLEVKFTVPYRLKRTEDFEARVVLTNTLSTPMRINGIALRFPTLVLKFKKTDQTQIPTGPPPFPVRDDGVTGRINLGPGHSVTFVYQSSELFPGRQLEDGDYLVRFVYQNRSGQYHDWTGSIVTEWLSFELSTR
jgi:hypothetical protein